MSSSDARTSSPADSDSDVPVAQQQQQQNADAALDTFISAHQLRADGSETSTPRRLQAPVVIPQRRPGNKERGFVKAYAPDLAAYGIDEASFLEFIGATNKAAQASKWLHAIQVAAMGTGFIPNHIALGVSAAVQIIAGIVAKAETRWKTNAFMDRMNEQFFRPRGLYCLIMSYNPIAMGQMAQPDPAQALSTHKRISTADAGPLSTAKRNLRSPTAGVSHGEESLPSTVATLVYPHTSKDKSSDSQSSQDAGEKKKKRAFTRLNNYFDRRAQARYAAESKGDILSAPQTKPFSNRYLDPNHPASNGGLLGLVSGGKLTPNVEEQRETLRSANATQQQAIRDQQAAQMANLDQVLQGMGLTPEQQQDYIRQYESVFEVQLKQFQQQSELLEQSHRRINRNILYLLIVNMPTEAELEVARNGWQSSAGFGQIEIDPVEVSD